MGRGAGVPTTFPDSRALGNSHLSSCCHVFLFARKGYRTDATVSVFLGFLLFLIPAKKPCFGKKSDGETREHFVLVSKMEGVAS